MCHSVLFGLLLSAFFVRVAMRWHRYQALGPGACGGGGCGGGFGGRRFGGPFGWRRWERFGHFADGFGGFERPGRAVHLGEIVRDLELNARQQEEAQPVLTQLREQLGHSPLRFRGALSAVAAESFDRARAERVVDGVAPDQRGKLLEGLEHLHNILIPEQREVLRARLQGQGAGAAGEPQGPSTML